MDGFCYDLWANSAWLDYLASRAFPEPEAAVFQHLLAAQEIWLLRFGGSSPTEMPTPDVSQATLQRIHDGWVAALQGEDQVVEYRRTTGEPGRRLLSEIAGHVVNHGTYHRGEMRGICRGRGEEGFPETDLIAFYARSGSNLGRRTKH